MSSKLQKKAKSRADPSKKYLKHPSVTKNEPFLRVYPSLINSGVFRSLSVHAQILYIRLSLRCMSTNPTFNTCHYPHSEQIKDFRPETFRKAKTELLSHGFIQERRATGNYAKEYRLSMRWQVLQEGETITEDEQYYG